MNSFEEETSKLSICPQFNYFWNGLTVDQNIEFMGEIKGLDPVTLEEHKSLLLDTLDLR